MDDRSDEFLKGKKQGMFETLSIIKSVITGEEPEYNLISDHMSIARSQQIVHTARSIFILRDALSKTTRQGIYNLNEAIAEVTGAPTIPQAAKEYLDLQPNKIFFQIGTNDGDDDFRLLVESYNPQKTFLVEPWAQLYSKIHESYTGKDYELIEGIIHDKDDDSALIHVHESNYGHSSLVPMATCPLSSITPVTVNAYNFNSVCADHNITEIELLMIDTEGYDFIILNSIDFNKIKVQNIIFENFNFDTETCYNNYKERDLLGITGRKNIVKKMSELNYTLTEFKDNITGELTGNAYFKLRGDEVVD
jgi:FkbM family methyltransferase|tara:strand:+ start:101 stop:1021 length:921 start_codon:yes stop_codon:yes gene_type:complete